MCEHKSKRNEKQIALRLLEFQDRLSWNEKAENALFPNVTGFSFKLIINISLIADTTSILCEFQISSKR